MTRGETASVNVNMKEETKQEERCFALPSIDLLGAARYFKIGDSVNEIGKRIIGTIEEINDSIVTVDWGLHSSDIHFADLEFSE